MHAGVSKRVLRLLYGPAEGTDLVVLTGGFLIPTMLELQDEFVFYIWYRLLYIVGALESIDSASVYLDFMKGVTTLVSTASRQFFYFPSNYYATS